jgi:hypothetical protein
LARNPECCRAGDGIETMSASGTQSERARASSRSHQGRECGASAAHAQIAGIPDARGRASDSDDAPDVC